MKIKKSEQKNIKQVTSCTGCNDNAELILSCRQYIGQRISQSQLRSVELQEIL